MKYNRILLKLSGEALLGKNLYGIDNDRLVDYAKEIKNIHDQGVEIAIVIGGGNIFRGLTGSKDGIDRVQADYMGMLATVINGLAIQNALENIKIPRAFDYDRLASLSHEAKEKLNKIQPTTLAQASRISGINPSDISVLLVSMGR